MKIHQYYTSFQPVTITLESKDELALFVRLLGAVPLSITDRFSLSHDSVIHCYESLGMLLDISGEYPMLSIAEVPSVIHQESKDTEVDWSKVPVGTPIEVCDDPDEEEWHETEFKHYFPTDDYPFMTIVNNHWKYARLIKE